MGKQRQPFKQDHHEWDDEKVHKKYRKSDSDPRYIKKKRLSEYDDEMLEANDFLSHQTELTQKQSTKKKENQRWDHH